MSGKNVLNKEQYEAFVNHKSIIEEKEQELSEAKKEVEKYKQEFHYIQEGLLKELARLIPETELKRIQESTLEDNEELGLGVSTDVILDKLLYVVTNGLEQADVNFDAARKEVDYLHNEKVRLNKLLEEADLAEGEVTLKLTDAEERIRRIQRDLDISNNLNRTLLDETEATTSGTTLIESNSKDLEKIERYKTKINKLIADSRKDKKKIKKPEEQNLIKMATDARKIIQDMIDYISKAVPKFSGTPSPTRAEELRVYLIACKIYHDTLEENDKVNYIRFLVALTLKDEASSLVGDQTINSFAEFKTILEDNYLPKNTLLSLCDDLRKCKQQLGEKVNDYGRRILEKRSKCRVAIDQLYPNERAGFITEYDEIALKTFKQGLSNGIMRQHAFLQTGTLEELIKRLGAIEEVGKDQFNQGSSNPIVKRNETSMRTPQNNMSPSNIGNFNNQRFRQTNNTYDRQPQLGNGYNNRSNGFGNQNRGVSYQNRGVTTQNNNSNSNRQLICYNCKQPGHTSRECRNRNQGVVNSNNTMERRNTPQQANNQVRMTREEICDFCLRAGHDIDNCHPKIRWDQKQRARSGNE